MTLQTDTCSESDSLESSMAGDKSAEENKKIKPLLINEIFYSLQGEATHAGMPCIFIRTTGCQMRCTYCDTEYAFFEGTKMTPEAIMQEIRKYNCKLVEITGGEPLLQKKNLLPLLSILQDEGYTLLMETGGGVDLSDLPGEMTIILDVKCPDSGETKNMNWDFLKSRRPNTVLKFVVSSKEDYEWSRNWIADHHAEIDGYPLYFSPVTDRFSANDLANLLLRDGLNARLQLQLHKQLWGNQRGV